MLSSATKLQPMGSPMRPYTFALLACLLLLPATGVSQSQSAPTTPRTRAPVTVLIVDRELPAGGRWIIDRNAAGRGGDRIVLARAANSSDLSDAVRALLIARRLQGDSVTTHSLLRARREQRTTLNERRELPWAARVLEDARRAPARTAPRWGAARSVRIFLPSQRRASR